MPAREIIKELVQKRLVGCSQVTYPHDNTAEQHVQTSWTSCNADYSIII